VGLGTPSRGGGYRWRGRHRAPSGQWRHRRRDSLGGAGSTDIGEQHVVGVGGALATAGVGVGGVCLGFHDFFLYASTWNPQSIRPCLVHAQNPKTF
jgi:hypothetical protein